MLPPPRRRVRGFTLIELMTVIVILAVLTLAAAPGMRSLISSQRARAATNALVADLLMARSEAVKRNKGVSLSPAPAWADGWAVKTVEATSELLGQRGGVGGGVTITRSPTSLTYDSAGRLSGVTSTVRFEVFDGNSTYRCITVQPSGQPSTNTKACP